MYKRYIFFLYKICINSLTSNKIIKELKPKELNPYLTHTHTHTHTHIYIYIYIYIITIDYFSRTIN